MSVLLENWFWILFALVVGFFLLQLTTKGWKGALFGARIAKSYDVIEQDRTGLTGGRVRIHLLVTRPQRSVGIEVVSTTPLSWEMIPIKLSVEAAQRLVDDLSAAIDEA
jgi:hypothetical protein